MDANEPNNENPNIVTVVITFDPQSGEIQVNGPLNNEMVMYFVLEKAKEITKEHIRRARAPLIAMPTAVPRNIRDLKN